MEIIRFFVRRIKIAIELIEEGSLAVGDMMSTLVFPLVPFSCEFVTILWFGLVAMFLASAGEQTYMVNVEECEEDSEVHAVMERYGGRGYECVGDQLPADISDKCPAATCDFLKYGTRDTAQYLQVKHSGVGWG